MPAASRIVIAYTGSPQALEAVPGLAAEYGEVIAVTLDAGQGKELEAVRDRALAAGASRAHVLDVREEFARGFIVPTLRAGALHREGRSAGAALERSLLAAKLVEVARIEQAQAIAHGWAGDERDAFERALRTLDPAAVLVALAPPWPPAAPVAARTRREPAREPAGADIAFARGVPFALNGIEMPVPDLVSSLGIIAEAHGVAAGEPGDGAAHLALQHALDALRRFRVDAPIERFSHVVAGEYARVVDRGEWFTPLRTALDAFLAAALDRASGLVRLRLFQGGIEAAAEPLPARPPLAIIQAEAQR